MRAAVWIVAPLIFASAPALADTIRVPADRPSIQAAIRIAEPADTILVAPGEYEISSPIDFASKAIRVASDSGPAATTIRRHNTFAHGSVVEFTSGEGTDSILEGFTLTGGTGTGETAPLGGGIICTNGSSPTLRDLVVVGNTAGYGGALYCRNSSPHVVDCTLSWNLVICGGGAYLHASSPRFERCTIAGNWGSYLGGGVHNTTGSAPVYDCCRFLGNQCPSGGAVDAFTSSPVLINCVIAGNIAERGAALYCVGSSTLLVHCTVASNRAEEGGDLFVSGPSPVLEGCIFWQNDPTVLPVGVGGVDPRFVAPGVFDFSRYAAVLTADGWRQRPDFIVEAPDYGLLPDSPAIDARLAAGAPETDIEGRPRPCGAGVDLGAYEACPPVRFRRGDATGDGRRNLADAVGILGYLFAGGPEIGCVDSADADDSGSLDLADPVFLLGWLFSGGLELAPPSAACEEDPTPDELGCARSSSCE